MSYESVPLRRYPSTDEDVLEQSGTQANAATNTATDHQSLADSTNTSTNSQPRADSTNTASDQQSLAGSTNTATDHQSLADSTSVDHNAQNAQCPAPQSTSSTLKRWLAELSAWITGLIALAAIIITIGLHNGRPLPDWPYSISVNALVSIFATILKAMMMIPIAEALSQFKWLWYQKSHPLVDLCTFDQASRGSWGCLQLLYRMRFTTIASMGALLTLLVAMSDPFIQQLIQYVPCEQEQTSQQASVMRSNNYTATGVHVAAGIQSLDLPMQAAIYQGVYDSPINISTTCGTGNCTFPDFRTIVDIFSFIGERYTSPSIEEIENQELSAVRCSLSPCIHTYALNVSQGVSKQYLIDSIPMTRSTNLTEKLPYANFMASPMPCLINGSYFNATAFAQPNATNIYNGTGLLPDDQPVWLPKECVFNYQDPTGLEQHLSTFLAGSIMVVPQSKNYDPPWLGKIYNEGNFSFANVSAKWDNMAISMTNNMRRNGAPENSAPATGVAFVVDTCIIVQWAWIAYPSLLLILTLGFLLAVVLQSAAGGNQMVWKSTPLALVFHGLSEIVTANPSLKLDETKQMEKLAEEIQVTVGNDGSRSKFSVMEKDEKLGRMSRANL
ncbi:hypothetical protein G7054_g9071 [Neopestalotiopsis clavispora]|nr:hypothetical protein G7054_g9071 [Neopestalotiopsis clavispora]